MQFINKSLRLILMLLLSTQMQNLGVNSQQSAQPKLMSGRIVSGSPANAGQFPFQVIIKRDEWDDLLCGGSIISKNWVLTAAHCLQSRDSIYLVFGTNVLNDEKALSMTATQLYVHADFNSYMNNDIGLVGLPTALTFSDKIQPVQLVTSSWASQCFVGYQATILGYGLMDDEYLNYSEQLLYAQVEVIDNAKCVDIFGAAVVLKSTICAIGAGNSKMSTCSGDSGGPLLYYDTSKSSYIQIGINSFVAEDQCTAGYPSGYLRLSSYLDYIEEVTKLNP